ncbi:MAG: hypothetical protein HZB40_02720 [Rhodocyclales bacterium]|nr:hypothetical protein [Rhodocyclales bacterium]
MPFKPELALGVTLLSLCISSCTSIPTPEPVPPTKPEQGTLPPQTIIQPEKIPHSRPESVRRAKPGPIPTRALNIATECSFRDETGYGGKLKLAINQAKVQAFEAAVDIPRRGSCKFDLKNFRQTREMPTVELSHLRDSCVVRVWEQGTRVTIAFQQCRKMCSGNAWDHLWPILNDRQDGSCA